VTALYVDTSALGRVLLREPDRDLVLEALGGYEQHVSSRLLRVELHRLGLRRGLGAEAAALAGAIALVPLDERILAEAESVLPSETATLDSLHLATALRLAHEGLLDTMITYDGVLAAGAAHHGLNVLAPA
jgi:predicted nucleic acid-binding protein